MARGDPEGPGSRPVACGPMDERGLLERVDSLTAAVADLGFKLETLISSTTAFRESFGERMTDYADLVAHWSIETEQNLQGQRRTLDRALAAQDEAVARLAASVEAAERRLLAAVEEASESEAVAEGLAEIRRQVAGLPRQVADLGPVLEEVRRLRDEPGVAAVSAEVAAVRGELAALAEALREDPADDDADALAPVLAELAAVRKDVAKLPRQATDVAPVVDELRRMREEPAQTDALAAVLAEVAAVRKDVAKLPRQATDVSAVVEELRQLRQVLSEADVDDVEDEVSFAAALGEQLAALRTDVAELAKQRPAAKRDVDPAVVEAIAGLRADIVALREQVAIVPPVPPEVTALTDALQALRGELENEPADVAAPPAPPDDRLEETLAELVYEVRALRRRFPVRPTTGDDDDDGMPSAPRRRRRSAE